tara:strand:- start:1749 stop:1991 length:243 start_codon:yes stop_codon:yes gene_type:complete
MKFRRIEENARVFPGEYILHVPSQTIVLVGAFKRGEGTIKALKSGKLIEDKIENFHKIELNAKERHVRQVKRNCGGCKGR